MMVLLISNLLLILFDFIFAIPQVHFFLKENLYSFFEFYNQNIHQRFFEIDLWFVGIFLAELLVRWGVAIYNRTYHRWFFYPFIHWYDVLGCIPIGSFRALRLLRVFSILVRLQRLEIIDLTKSYVFGKVKKYVGIVTEEISDRVVVNVLEGVQQEITHGTPIADRIVDDVVLPHKPMLIDWISKRTQQVLGHAHENYIDEIRGYVDEKIKEAVTKNKEIKRIEQVPMLGKIVSENLERAIGDIVFNVVDGMLRDLSSAKNKAIMEDITDMAIESIVAEEKDERLDRAVKQMAVEALEIVKEQVKVQQWKINAPSTTEKEEDKLQ